MHIPRSLSSAFCKFVVLIGCVSSWLVENTYNGVEKGVTVPCMLNTKSEVRNSKLNVLNI